MVKATPWHPSGADRTIETTSAIERGPLVEWAATKRERPAAGRTVMFAAGRRTGRRR